MCIRDSFNSIIQTLEWPNQWKVETVTVIPKCTNPESLSECRNISCTNFLSKVMESVVLESLRLEIKMDPIQYGGVRGSGVEHLLVEIWERVWGGLEIKDVSVAILGIDYEKAFNRMSHNECLRQLALLGASQSSVDVVGSFLHLRQMQTRVGSTTGGSRRISAGSPQGSILGCFLYCITTQQLGRNLITMDEENGSAASSTEDDFQMATLPLTSTPNLSLIHI